MRVLKQAMETGCVEIAQHGWTHQKIDGQGTEFVGLPLEAQRDMIERGRDEIETALNTNVDVFIPPFNSHDQNTLLALRDLGFAAISSEARSSNVVDGIHYVPCTTSLQELDVAMKARRQHAGAAIVVALFHGHDFVESGFRNALLDFNEFDELLERTCTLPNVRFSTIIDESQMTDWGHDLTTNVAYARNREQIERIKDISRLFGPFGMDRTVERVLPNHYAVYLEKDMITIHTRLLALEIAVEATVFFFSCALVFGLFRLAVKGSRGRFAATCVAVGGLLCFVFLLLEGSLGIVSVPGFGSRLLLFTVACAGSTFGAALDVASSRNVV